ncbi:CCA tRNA nucleotidyltransferase [bacterium]|nr:CCA tRNA nucleotidyltransferase [bacterium]
MQVTPIHRIRTRLPLVASVLDTLVSQGIQPVLVGGAVRDWIMGTESNDIDIEIFGIESLDDLKRFLKPLGEMSPIGATFGILRYNSPEGNVDFSLPRIEAKTGPGHTGFEIRLTPTISYPEAASRRDFTVNSIGMDWYTGRVMDPFDGKGDIVRRRLRHIGPAFIEDPLRVLRAAQFAARLQFDIAPETAALCRQMPLSELPKKRLYDELQKLFQKTTTPSRGIKYFEELGILEEWPEISRVLKDSNCAAATLHCIDALAKRSKSTAPMSLMLAAFLLFSQTLIPETPMAIADAFLSRISDSNRINSAIRSLIYVTMKLAILAEKAGISDADLYQASARTSLRKVVQLLLAGFPNQPRVHRFVLARATELDILDAPPKPLLTGKDLVSLGVEPGPQFKEILTHFYTAQLAGKITSKDQAIQLLTQLFEEDSEEE